MLRRVKIRKRGEVMKILFFCYGNICRSPKMRRRNLFRSEPRGRSPSREAVARGRAEFVMKDLVRKAGLEGVEIESAALHKNYSSP